MTYIEEDKTIINTAAKVERVARALCILNRRDPDEIANGYTTITNMDRQLCAARDAILATQIVADEDARRIAAIFDGPTIIQDRA